MATNEIVGATRRGDRFNWTGTGSSMIRFFLIALFAADKTLVGSLPGREAGGLQRRFVDSGLALAGVWQISEQLLAC